MLNHIVMQGRIVHSLELKATQAGVPMCSFRIACDRPYSKGGEKQTDFIDCVSWRKTAEFIQKFFDKGQLIIVAGRLQTDKYTGRDGTEKTSYKIQVSDAYFSESRRSQQEAAEQDAFEASRRPTQNDAFTDIDVEEADLPF